MAKVKHILTGIRLALLLLVGLGIVACEGIGNGGLTVTPASIDMWGSDNAVTFTVVRDADATPNETYEWWVNDDSLGSVTPGTGDQVLYFRTAKTGDNYVFVRDVARASVLASSLESVSRGDRLDVPAFNIATGGETTENSDYLTTITVSDYTSGIVRLNLGANGGSPNTNLSANGVYTEVIKATGSTSTFGIYSQALSTPLFIGSIDNVSVKRKLLNS